MPRPVQIASSPLFTTITPASPEGVVTYRLNTTQLPPDQCHLFFPLHCRNEMLIITALEFSLFHPKTALNQKFHLSIVTFPHNFQVIWCHFPKQFQETCLKVAATFDMTPTGENRAMLLRDRLVSFPKHDQILFFRGPDMTDSQIDRSMADVKALGDRLQASGID